MLLREGVQAADDLGNRRHQLPHHLAHVLLAKLTLLLADTLLPMGRLHLREALPLLLGKGILLLCLKMLRPMLLTLGAMDGRRLHLRLPLQDADDLRHDRQDLTHHLLHILRRQGPLLLLLLAIAVTKRRLWLQLLLGLGDDLRQKRH